MQKKNFFAKKLFIIGVVIFLSLIINIPEAIAQIEPFPNPFFGFIPLGYVPFLPPPPLFIAPSFLTSDRYANVPATTTLFPAPTLPTIPAATIGSVGVTTLIPTVSIIASVPASVLITTPLSPLITYTPLSLVGLTYAPVPVTTPLLLFP